MKTMPVIRCEVTNEPIPAGEMTFLSYFEVRNENGTFKRVNRGIQLGPTMTKEILHLIYEKRKERKS